MSSVAPVFGQDPSSADWLAPRLSGRWGSVTGNLPDGYPAYIRLLHPLDDDGVTRSWRDIAAEFGTRTHPLVQWVPLLGRRYNSNDVMWRNTSPEQGNLDPAVLQLLLGVLAQHTGTVDDCWFCVWDGWGGFVPARQLPLPGRRRYPNLVGLPHREYQLARGSLESALHLQAENEWADCQSPNLFWPADRAWCAASEIDFDSTLIAGSEELAAQLMSTEGLETWRVEPHDSLAYDADQINKI